MLILVDPGSNHNLITHNLVVWLKLPSQTTSLSLKVLDHRRKEQRLHTYVLVITDRHRARHTVQAIGMDNITEVEHSPKVKEWIKLLPGVGQKQMRAFDRPHGTVQLLLRMELHSLHSKDGREVGDLRLNRTLFHPGWVLTGRAITQSEGVS